MLEAVVVCENSHIYIWEFYRHINSNDYGNGTYITVIKENEIEAYVDMRYTKYNFKSWIISYLRQYYGDRLLKLEINPIEIPF